MSGEVSCRPPGRRVLLFFAGLSAAGAGAALVRCGVPGAGRVAGGRRAARAAGRRGAPKATARVRADTYGVHSWTLLRRRSVRWGDIADLRVRLKYANTPGSRTPVVSACCCATDAGCSCRCRGAGPYDDPDFDAKLDAFRALHRLHGTPESDHVPVVVVPHRRTGLGRVAGPVPAAARGRGPAAWFVPDAASGERAWGGHPCTAGTPAAERDECLTTLPAVIARTDVTRSRNRAVGCTSSTAGRWSGSRSRRTARGCSGPATASN